MVICPNCEHENPDSAIQCEACYTPLPQTIQCPHCGSPVLSNATFCGQCGASLQTVGSATVPSSPPPPPPPFAAMMAQMPPDPWATFPMSAPPPYRDIEEPSTEPASTQLSPPPPPPNEPSTVGFTQIQVQKASLFHVQTETHLELPQGLEVIHIGKPNPKIPPDIDISGFPHADIVSRIHADIRVEGDGFYIEDVGSSNGTYINHKSLPHGNRHRLRSGDRISLGKGDLVTLIFQLF
ncbi:FHA domain containing protein [Rippkaea orientalis PCC 8801]|uniref:FHA domain containing protein n=1 Tax=Rippkaea orientalis (strain PCC 8801 / RF-1) TaxID=41431 RepID=B7K4P8_RIPO1|nr:FHA domain-containing protein [Rippkaea orientalis]ACK65513.1 FHA domain containing protein [Rippkaea orientalis PCC 8801]